MAHTHLVLKDKDEILCFCGKEMPIMTGTTYILHYPKCTHCGTRCDGFTRMHVCQNDKKHVKFENEKKWLVESNHEFGNTAVYNHILCRDCRRWRINQNTYWTVERDHYQYIQRTIKND